MQNYVKFQKGTIEAYENLKKQNRIEENTLYFIYNESNLNQGLLYFGNRLIGGNQEILNLSLKDLIDIQSFEPKENSLLIFNNDIWHDINLNQFIELIKENSELQNFITSTTDNFEVQDGNLSLKNINISQVQNLQKLLDSKVTKQDNSRLIKEDEIQTLNDLKEKINNSIIFSEINTKNLQISNNILDFSQTVVQDFNSLIELKQKIGNLNDLTKEENETLVDVVNGIKDTLNWGDI